MAKNNYDHHHNYRTVNSKHKIYRCIVEGCPHSIVASLLIGRRAGCTTCGGVFIVTKDHLRRANLTCIGCGITPGLRNTEINPIKSLRIKRDKPATMSEIMEQAKRSILAMELNEDS